MTEFPVIKEISFESFSCFREGAAQPPLHDTKRGTTTNLVSQQRQGWHLLPKMTILKRRSRLNLMTMQPLIIRVTNARGFLARNVSNHDRKMPDSMSNVFFPFHQQ